VLATDPRRSRSHRPLAPAKTPARIRNRSGETRVGSAHFLNG